MRTRSALLSLIVVGLTACGGTDEAAPRATSPTGAPSPAAPQCSPSGTTLAISAQNHKFDKDCLAAPANTAFSIEFTNKEKPPGGHSHNVSIESTSGTRTFFSGKVIQADKTVDYAVDPLPAGTYAFECDVHPTSMKGTFLVA